MAEVLEPAIDELDVPPEPVLVPPPLAAGGEPALPAVCALTSSSTAKLATPMPSSEIATRRDRRLMLAQISKSDSSMAFPQ